jgi:hypothetical protein
VDEFNTQKEKQKKKAKRVTAPSTSTNAVEQTAEEVTDESEVNPKPCSSQKLESIKTFLKSPTNHLYAFFLSYTNRAYDTVLVKLQAEEPLIHQLLPFLQ